MDTPAPSWQTLPVTPDRFEDFADVVNPNRRASHCWCLSHRCTAAEIREVGDGDRQRAMRALTDQAPQGVVTYRDGVAVGWCSIGPRADNTRLSTSKLMRPVDDVAVWSIICVVVRSGHRKQGVVHEMIGGALAWARSQGAPAVEAYPVDPPGRMDLTMAFVGTRSMFEPHGFELIGTTAAVASKHPRLVMRHTF